MRVFTISNYNAYYYNIIHCIPTIILFIHKVIYIYKIEQHLTINTWITLVNIVNNNIYITNVTIFALQKYNDYICKNYRK